MRPPSTTVERHCRPPREAGISALWRGFWPRMPKLTQLQPTLAELPCRQPQKAAISKLSRGYLLQKPTLMQLRPPAMAERHYKLLPGKVISTLWRDSSSRRLMLMQAQVALVAQHCRQLQKAATLKS